MNINAWQSSLGLELDAIVGNTEFKAIYRGFTREQAKANFASRVQRYLDANPLTDGLKIVDLNYSKF